MYSAGAGAAELGKWLPLAGWLADVAGARFLNGWLESQVSRSSRRTDASSGHRARQTHTHTHTQCFASFARCHGLSAVPRVRARAGRAEFQPTERPINYLSWPSHPGAVSQPSRRIENRHHCSCRPGPFLPLPLSPPPPRKTTSEMETTPDSVGSPLGRPGSRRRGQTATVAMQVALHYTLAPCLFVCLQNARRML